MSRKGAFQLQKLRKLNITQKRKHGAREKYFHDGKKWTWRELRVVKCGNEIRKQGILERGTKGDQFEGLFPVHCFLL